ncbi:MAG: phytoene/squalene synthase family protein [Chloroflexota bacterium]|nr:phytoene/squalene synthase family protein [Chloroflexota bacterium]
MTIHLHIMDTLQETSRTFFIPISRLPSGLQEAVASAYLCMRAVDEIEDHPHMERRTKIRHLRKISQILQAQTSVDIFAREDFSAAFAEQQSTLPAVTLGLAEWACYAPASIAPRIWDAIAAMAERMAYWVGNGWKIRTEADLDRYTFAVAGSVGLMLCDIWAWFHGEQLSRIHALHFGRGLQAVNILRNRTDDLARGVDFFPAGWTHEDMHSYAYGHLSEAETYARTLSSDFFASFISIPLALAYGTLDALARGEAKLSRSAVLQLLQQIDEG